MQFQKMQQLKSSAQNFCSVAIPQTNNQK